MTNESPQFHRALFEPYEFELGSVSPGEVGLDALVAGRFVDVVKNPQGKYRLYRVGDAVASRNVHAALWDSLRNLQSSLSRSVRGVMDEHEHDVIVIGSGAAGLSAALSAGARGSRVLVLEKSQLVGGTTALSGGGTWVPCHHHQAAIGATDSREEALDYIRAIAPQGWHNVEEPLWRAFVHCAPEMLTFVEAKSPLRFAPSLEPDPYVEAPGGKRFGRMLSPRPNLGPVPRTLAQTHPGTDVLPVD